MRLNEVSNTQFQHQPPKKRMQKNKWRWEWMEGRDSEGQKNGEWLKKPEATDMAFYDACGPWLDQYSL